MGSYQLLTSADQAYILVVPFDLIVQDLLPCPNIKASEKTLMIGGKPLADYHVHGTLCELPKMAYLIGV